MAATQNESKIPVGAVLLGKFKVTREIGRGGMAAVYEAVHLSLNKRIAIKVLAAELSASTVVIERFFREARAAASVRSPHIVDVYDSGRLDDGRPFIAMELLEGESLYDRMARVRIIDIPTTVRVIQHCAKGLVKAHAAGIVHRDLKPENIFLTHDENGEELCKILDFGLAKFYSPVATDEKTARLTREGAVFGTPAYMSPEQVKGQGNVDHRADLWALGCMAFECLIGRPVWNTDQGVAMTFAAIAAANIPVPSKQRPDLPPSFDEWFKRALERDPNRRFQTAKELADALTVAFGSEQHISSVNFSGEASAQAAMAMAAQLPSQSEAFVLDDEQAMGTRVRSDRSVDRGGTPAPVSQPQPRTRNLSPTGIPALHTSPSGNLVPQPSLLDAPPTSTPASGPHPDQLHPTGPPPKFRSNGVRYFMSITGFSIGAVAAYISWSQYLRPQVYTPLVVSSASLPVAPTASAAPGEPPVQDGEPRWATPLEEGQRLFTVGNAADARKKFAEATDLGAGAVARSFLDELRIPQSGPCKLTAFSHPRLGIGGSISRPAIANGGKGAIVVWTDDHEQPGHDHAYSVMIDGTGRPLSRPRDLTPEGNDIMRPSLLEAGEKTLLYYWDKSGREAGIRARWLDAEGRIAGASVLVGAGKPGLYWPSIDRAPDGYYVAWSADREKDGSDLWLRHLNSDLQPVAPELRATDYWGGSKPKQQPQVRTPAIALASNAIYVTYKLERESQHQIILMRVPLTLPSLQTGLDDKPGLLPDGGRGDRELGDAEVVNEDKANADAPAIACGTEGCFLAWHGESGGAYAALIEPVLGRVLWRKKFAPLGGHPSLATSSGGQVEVAYYEKGFVRIAQLTRDGIGTASTIGRVGNEQPRPWIASGAQKGEWLVAWQDSEANHLEAFAARVQCR
ncbi:MAG TPA: serine/threonine-protein kinase, partial [Polyangiaceae bacterium]